MNELRETPEEELESYESRTSEQQAMDEATHDPRTHIEQTGDYQQAEAIQAALTEITENINMGEKTGRIPISIPRPEDEGIIGSQPRVRDDLDQVTTSGGEGGREEATPINLPGPQIRSADSDSVACDGASKQEALPLGGGVQVSRRFSWEEQADLGDEPDQPIEFEKPMLYEDLTEQPQDLGALEDIDSLIPAPGKIGGAPGEKDPGSDLLGEIPGLDIKGSSSDLKNAPGADSGKGHDIPGWDSPFPPGKGPNAGKETTEGGTKKPSPPNKNDSDGQGKKKGEGDGQGGKKESPGPDVKVEATFFTAKTVRALEIAAFRALDQREYAKFGAVMSTLNKIYESNFEAGKKGGVVFSPSGSTESTPDDVGGGRDPNEPISAQLEGKALNPKFDQEQISTQTEEQAGSTLGGGMLKPEAVKAVKRTAEMKGKIANAKPKTGAEQITDPPEHDPGKKSETSKKSG